MGRVSQPLNILRACIGGVVSGALGKVRLVVEGKGSFVAIHYSYSENRNIGDADPRTRAKAAGVTDYFLLFRWDLSGERDWVSGDYAGALASLFARRVKTIFDDKRREADNKFLRLILLNTDIKVSQGDSNPNANLSDKLCPESL